MASHPQRDLDFGRLLQRILADFFEGISPDPDFLTGFLADFFIFVCLHPFTLGLLLPFADVKIQNVLFHSCKAIYTCTFTIQV